MLRGVTFSGGDPFEQADKFAYLAKGVRSSKLNVWCYTGYTFEYIIEHLDTKTGWKDLLNNIDVLVDGKFKEDKMEEGLKYRGSSNQRLINVVESLKQNKVVTLDM